MLKIYVCGPTVYDELHIGNMRPILTFDLMLKAARYLKKDFIFIHNITDIDDKIIFKAKEQNISEKELAQKYSQKYLNHLKTFSVDTITKLEYVTKNLEYIESFLDKLYKRDNAYLIENSGLYFNVEKNLNNYGKISNQNLDDMHFDFDLNSKLQKYNKADFALWKNTSEGIKFDSKFGQGRPGWHTECVALIEKNFGDSQLDIHGGGVDLIFPHHENENIQYQALYQKDITKKWLRSGQINLNNEKMSKSLQNIISVDAFLENNSGNTLKFIFLMSSLTANINLNENLISDASNLDKKLIKLSFLAKVNNLEIKPCDVSKEMEFLFELSFSKFMFEVNALLKNANKNDLEALNKLLFLFNTLGFSYNKLDFSSEIQTYKKWKAALELKDYKSADLLREDLLKKNLI
ncbi:class I tRNA ligase family protein [Mycoplasmopsis synoviae]|uniref:Cysteinyl-tRNA synthetase n=2 Tax=Mycoplasmopsis synoviae TaxID=2109 RepID=Q4A652_MYCS5|nr:class I tRNA ligase family protein [Mycoplasmopsis synoviae]AAZ43769.1 cysteinyl-tRNA synthetase [Mycoplasmopsis synoviae 53]